jgi:hypothetical protein
MRHDAYYFYRDAIADLLKETQVLSVLKEPADRNTPEARSGVRPLLLVDRLYVRLRLCSAPTGGANQTLPSQLRFEQNGVTLSDAENG